MATISTPGIGSGLDVQSIVSQLVALERAPIQQLQTQASTLQTRLSLYGTIKSQISALGDAASKLSSSNAWKAVTAASSNSTAVTASATAGATAGSYSIEVQQLARAQSTVSSAVVSGSNIGTGTLTIELGGWTGSTFSPSGSTPVSVTIGAGEDSLSAIASKINAADAGVKATVLRDASGERLLMQSAETGATQGFRITASDDDGNNADATGLSRLSYSAGGASGTSLAQSGLNAQATINGVAIISSTNKLADTLPGLTLQLSQVTSQPVEVTVASDKESIRKDIDAFVEAYNKVNSTLANALKYDEGSKQGGTLQGDSTAVGLQNALRGMMRSVTTSTPFSRLVDVGIELKSGGALQIDSGKMTAAMDNLKGLQDMFTVDTGNATTEGFGRKLKAFANGLLDTDGSLSARTEALQSAIKRNSTEQERMEDRVSRVETRLLAQYTALDTKLAGLTSLSSYVSQQVAMWNNGGS